jgi:thioesterase domain-containing protein
MSGRARDAFEYQVVKACAEVLGRPMGVDDELVLAGDPVAADRLRTRIEELTGRSVERAPESGTVEALARKVRGAPKRGRWSSVVPLRPGGDGRPLFLLHPIGGNVWWYEPLAQGLAPEHPVYGLQSVGLDPDERPHESIEEMAAHYVEEIARVDPDGPYLLAGWSYGGMVAYEMARQLRAAGRPVGLLALLDASTTDPSRAPEERWEIPMRLLTNALRVYPRIDEVLALERGDQLELLREIAIEHGTLPPGYPLAHMRRMHELNAVNVGALGSYRPGRYEGEVTLLRAGARGTEGGGDFHDGEDLGWGELVDSVVIRTVPGVNHFSFLRRESVPAVAELLSDCLARADRALTAAR